MPKDKYLCAELDGEGHHRLTSNANAIAKKKRKNKSKSKNNERNESERGCDFDDDAGESPRKKLKKEKKGGRGEKRKLSKSSDDVFEKSKKKKGKGRKGDGRDGAGDEREGEANRFPFQYRHVLAPMVGASELAFRLLCRRYGATLSYTPMMSASQFVKEAEGKSAAEVARSNVCEFQTIPQDRPLVVHFSASDPGDFARAARLVESSCDAVDLNLGCPQRTAYLGHFGSYLLGDADRRLVLDIVRAAAEAVSIPIFVKIRLLDTVGETIRLCHDLRGAGASLIAIHARYRATWERTGPGARDGAALLDQVSLVKQSMPEFPIICNGNVITYGDVVENRKLTGADGIMSAEGILNNPALYLPRFGDVDEDGDREVSVPVLSPLHRGDGPDEKEGKSIRKLQKKLRKIEVIEKKVEESGEESINDDQRSKLREKSKVLTRLNGFENRPPSPSKLPNSEPKSQTISVKLSDLFKVADNKIDLAREYLSLVRAYPTKIRSVVFHVRRMCQKLLEQYQLLEECVASATIEQVEAVLSKCERYAQHPDTFRHDREKSAREKEAAIRRRREDGKRKAYEGRMTRKAKREGLADLEHYLRIGAQVPTVEIVEELKEAPKEERLAAWKKDHSQHCMPYHLDDGGCKRDRTCAFLHVEAKDGNKFVADDEVAG